MSSFQQNPMRHAENKMWPIPRKGGGRKLAMESESNQISVLGKTTKL